MYNLDFTLLPDMSRGSVRTASGENTSRKLSVLTQTFDRAQSAMQLAYYLNSVETFFSHADSKLRESFLRASLAEFVSMEETLIRDLKRNGITNKSIIKATDSANPLLHIVRELRNLEIHLHSSSIHTSRTKFYLPHQTEPDKDLEIDLDIWFIGDISITDFKHLRNSKRYNNNDIVDMLNWFNKSQKIYGIHEILRMAIQEYSELIITFYGF